MAERQARTDAPPDRQAWLQDRRPAVEEVSEADIDAAFAAAQARRLPALRGEVIEGDVAGYHFYPGREQVIRWLEAEDLAIVAEDFDQEDGWGYRHLLVRSRRLGAPRIVRQSPQLRDRVLPSMFGS